MRGCLKGLLIGIVLGLAVTACTLTGSEDGKSPASASAVPTLSTSTLGGDSLVVAWVERGDLVVWRSGEPAPRRIAGGGAIRPIIAPDGEWIAYIRGPDGDPRSLWVSDTPGAAERQLVDGGSLPGIDEARRLNQIVWAADSNAVLFNTFTGSGIDTRPADDLWRVTLATGSVERLLSDGAGGQMALSPDGAHVALAFAGEYAQPGETSESLSLIAFYTLATGVRWPVLEFPAVATASETRWYPTLHWLPDSMGVLTAIPDPDLVYGSGATTVWQLSLTGDADQIGQVDADFFGLPVFSFQGNWMAYFQRRDSVQQTTLTLMIGRSDGASVEPYITGQIGTLTVSQWLPEGEQFVFMQGEPGRAWLGQPGTGPVRFPDPNTPVHQLTWVDARTGVLSVSSGDQYALYAAYQDEPLQHITTTDVYPVFDAMRP